MILGEPLTVKTKYRWRIAHLYRLTYLFDLSWAFNKSVVFDLNHFDIKCKLLRKLCPWQVCGMRLLSLLGIILHYKRVYDPQYINYLILVLF